jgi:hypothetical protein
VAIPIQTLAQPIVDVSGPARDEPSADDATRPVRKGWWQRKFGA